MASTQTLAQRSAAATAAKDTIDLERSDALLGLAASPAFNEVLEKATAIHDITEQSASGINACAFQLVTVMKNLAVNAGNERSRIDVRLNPPAIQAAPIPAAA